MIRESVHDTKSHTRLGRERVARENHDFEKRVKEENEKQDRQLPT
jgi:hypothetical protein